MSRLLRNAAESDVSEAELQRRLSHLTTGQLRQIVAEIEAVEAADEPHEALFRAELAAREAS